MADQKKQCAKVSQLRPFDTGLTLIVKVVSTKVVAQRSRAHGRFSECLVGDETGMIIFAARNDQDWKIENDPPRLTTGSQDLDLANDDNTLILSNAKIDMFKGSMRLVVDRSGRVEAGEPASFRVEESNNLSLIEFDRYDVAV